MLLAWVLQPLLLLIIAVGIGRCVEAGARVRLSLEMLVAIGAAGAVVVADLSRLVPVDGVATVAVPVVAGLGLIFGRRGLARRPDWVSWAGVSAGLVVLAAPFLRAWQPTFGGYTTLGDTAIQMLGAELLPRGAHALEDLDPSAVTAVLDSYFLGNGYPAAAQTLAGVTAKLLGAWSVETYQPFLLVLCGVLGLAVADMVRGRVNGLARGSAVLTAVCAPLITAYAWQGSIKEVAGAAFIAVTCAAMPTRVEDAGGASWRQGVPFVVAAAAVLGALGFPGGMWLLPIAGVGVGAFLASGERPSTRAAVRWVAPLGVTFLVLSWPTWRSLPDLWTVAPAVLTLPNELGNLLRPLPSWQVVASWPVPDYRQRPDGALLQTSVLSAVLVGGLMVVGCYSAVRARAVGLVAWGASCASAWLAVSLAGSPWSVAKTMALAAPAAFALAVVGGAWVARRLPRTIAPLVVLLPVVAAVVSDVQGARGLALAPIATLRELHDVTAQARGGPTLIVDNDEFAKVAAADAAPEVIGDVWRGRAVRGPDGAVISGTGAVVDLDALGPSGLAGFTWVVVRRGPSMSWPAGFRVLAASDRFLLFRRSATGVVRGFSGQGEPLVLAAADGVCPEGGRSRVGLPRAAASVTTVDDWRYPAAWALSNGPGGAFLRLRGGGEGVGELVVSVPGRYRVWVGGSFPVPVTVTVAGKHVHGEATRRNFGAKLEPLGTVALPPGTHRVVVRVPDGGLLPGGSASSSVPGTLAGVWVERLEARRRSSNVSCRADRPFDWLARIG